MSADSVEPNSGEPKNAGDANSEGNSRRSFLMKLGLGAAGLAGLSSGLFRLGGQTEAAQQDEDEFPGPDSIFHPAQDPRTDPRRG